MSRFVVILANDPWIHESALLTPERPQTTSVATLSPLFSTARIVFVSPQRRELSSHLDVLPTSQTDKYTPITWAQLSRDKHIAYYDGRLWYRTHLDATAPQSALVVPDRSPREAP